MFIDYFTLKCRIPLELLDWAYSYVKNHKHIVCFTPSTHDIHWQSSIRESIASDTHQVIILVDVDKEQIQLLGSPSRALGLINNVFGLSSFRDAAAAMRDCACKVLGVILPALDAKIDNSNVFYWRCSRVDLTKNFLFASASDVKAALELFAGHQGARACLSEAVALDNPSHITRRSNSPTIYWARASRYVSSKMYAKGVHLRYQLKNHKANIDNNDDLLLVDRLLRFEITIGSVFFAQHLLHNTHFLNDNFLSLLIDTYMRKEIEIMGENITIPSVGCELDALISVCPSDNMARAVFRSYLFIREYGYSYFKENTPRNTFYRHVKFMKLAGLRPEDITRNNVVRLVRTIKFQEVNSWDELRALAVNH